MCNSHSSVCGGEADSPPRGGGGKSKRVEENKGNTKGTPARLGSNIHFPYFYIVSEIVTMNYFKDFFKDVCIYMYFLPSPKDIQAY